jgi:hypothetical protein
MKTLTSSFAAIAVVLVLSGCATASQPNPQPTEKVLARTNAGEIRSYEGKQGGTITVKGSSEAVLEALRSAYKDLGIDVELWDPPHGQVGNRSFTKMYRLAGDRMSHFVGCGITEMGQAADAFRITMSVVSDVTAAGDGWQIDTRLDAHADDLASSKGRIACQSKGTLEEKLNELVAKHLGS